MERLVHATKYNQMNFDAFKSKLKKLCPGAAVKLCLGDLLVMGSNPETASLHMQG